jgi:hypothetical protein
MSSGLDNLLTEFPKSAKKRKGALVKKNKQIIMEEEEILKEEANNNVQEDHNDGYSTPKESPSISSKDSKISHISSKNKKKKTENKEDNYLPISSEEELNEQNNPNISAKSVNIIDDLDAMFETDNNDQVTVTSNNSSKQTVVDIIRIYSTNSVLGNTLVGFTSSNMYGGRNYLSDTINACTKLMYYTYITTLLTDPKFTKIKTDVAYLFHKNNRPINFVSYLPKVENSYYIEKIDETLIKLVSYFDGKPDPSNEGKVFKINFLPDFYLDSDERKKPFIYLCKKMALPERLTASYQAVMDQAGVLPIAN